MNDQKIREQFSIYVMSMADQERHTDSAVKETMQMEGLLEKWFPNDPHRQVELSGMAMDLAVEYEESGFIAGYRWAMALFGVERVVA